VIERTRPETCLSDLALDRLIAGELAGDERERAQTHVASCEACRGRRNALDADVRAFPDQLFVAMAAEQARTAAGFGKRGWKVYAAIAVPIAAAAAIAIWLAIPRDRPARVDEDGVRTKGGLVLDVIAKRRDGMTEPLGPGATAAPGDAVRFVVSTEAGGRLVVVGLDSAGTASSYVDAAIAPGRAQPQEGSVILDATPGVEKFIAVVCPRRADVLAAAERALRDAGDDPRRVERLALDAACAQASFLVTKAVP
jgi:hypothetical protein